MGARQAHCVMGTSISHLRCARRAAAHGWGSSGGVSCISLQLYSQNAHSRGRMVGAVGHEVQRFVVSAVTTPIEATLHIHHGTPNPLALPRSRALIGDGQLLFLCPSACVPISLSHSLPALRADSASPPRDYFSPVDTRYVVGCPVSTPSVAHTRPSVPCIRPPPPPHVQRRHRAADHATRVDAAVQASRVAVHAVQDTRVPRARRTRQR